MYKKQESKKILGYSKSSYTVRINWKLIDGFMESYSYSSLESSDSLLYIFVPKRESHVSLKNLTFIRKFKIFYASIIHQNARRSTSSL